MGARAGGEAHCKRKCFLYGEIVFMIIDLSKSINANSTGFTPSQADSPKALHGLRYN